MLFYNKNLDHFNIQIEIQAIGLTFIFYIDLNE